MGRNVGWNECEYVYKKPLNEYMIITTTTYVLHTIPTVRNLHRLLRMYESL
jgi:hypothetical protein